MKSRHFLLTVLQAEMNMRVSARLALEESLLPGDIMRSSPVSSHGRRGRDLAQASFMRALIPFMRLLPQVLIISKFPHHIT